MMRALNARLRQGYRNQSFSPRKTPALSPRYAGLPQLDPGACNACGECEKRPARRRRFPAHVAPSELKLDLGDAAFFCGECERACDQGAISFSKNLQDGRDGAGKGLCLAKKYGKCASKRLNDEMLRYFGHAHEDFAW